MFNLKNLYSNYDLLKQTYLLHLVHPGAAENIYSISSCFKVPDFLKRNSNAITHRSQSKIITLSTHTQLK